MPWRLKVGQTAIVTENELFWHFGHIQRGTTKKYEILRWLISIIPVVSEKVKAKKPIDGPFGIFIFYHGG